MACSPSVSISRRRSTGGDPDRTVLWVRGDHDIATRVSIAVAIARAAQRDDMSLLVDLSAVTFMDASTVGAIVGSRNRLQSRGQSLDVRAPSPPALRVLELCGIAHLIEQEPLHLTGAAAALATWVDVLPIAPAERIDHDAGRVTARSGTREPARVLAGADVHVEEAPATVDVDYGGP